MSKSPASARTRSRSHESTLSNRYPVDLDFRRPDETVQRLFVASGIHSDLITTDGHGDRIGANTAVGVAGRAAVVGVDALAGRVCFGTPRPFPLGI
ncbi:hypothetical protein [Halapricum desulfuricans]|uniref:hypothetical protein n=1 Tax=Halapricum desulfuricans TaxID=2841257 RepID=UPI001E2CD920|nr:hypothetical protein [Halapricum desulfuricans]